MVFYLQIKFATARKMPLRNLVRNGADFIVSHALQLENEPAQTKRVEMFLENDPILLANKAGDPFKKCPCGIWRKTVPISMYLMPCSSRTSLHKQNV